MRVSEPSAQCWTCLGLALFLTAIVAGLANLIGMSLILIAIAIPFLARAAHLAKQAHPQFGLMRSLALNFSIAATLGSSLAPTFMANCCGDGSFRQRRQERREQKIRELESLPPTKWNDVQTMNDNATPPQGRGYDDNHGFPRSYVLGNHTKPVS